MLIQALSDYYDTLAEAGKVLPQGYSNVKIHQCICLTPEGQIDAIIDLQISEQISTAKSRKGWFHVMNLCHSGQKNQLLMPILLSIVRSIFLA